VKDGSEDGGINSNLQDFGLGEHLYVSKATIATWLDILLSVSGDSSP
jgi:hypothetical protein